MNPNSYNRSEGDLNFYDRDDYPKFSLYGNDSETYQDLLNTVDAIIPGQDSHLLLEQDTSLMDICSSFDKRMDFGDFDTGKNLYSDSQQLLNDSYHNSTPGAVGGYGAIGLPNLSPASERRRLHKKSKKRNTKDDQFSPPDSLYPDSNRLPVASGISEYPSYSNNLRYEDNYQDSYREDQVPVININANDQFSVINYGDYECNDSNAECQSNTLSGTNDILYSAMNSANLSPGTQSEDSVSQDYLNNSSFSTSMKDEENLSQDSHDTEQFDYSKLSDGEKYRRLRDLNNKASQDYRRRKKEKVSEIGNQMPELEEKHRKLTNKSQQLESLRNDMLQYYNMKFNTQYRPGDVLTLHR